MVYKSQFQQQIPNQLVELRPETAKNLAKSSEPWPRYDRVADFTLSLNLVRLSGETELKHEIPFAQRKNKTDRWISLNNLFV